MNMGNGAGGVSTNTAFGASALNANVSGTQITAVGSGAYALGTAGQNEAFGVNAMGSAVVTGGNNSAFGRSSLTSLTSGTANVGFGQGSLELNTTGSYNTAIGRLALLLNTTGGNNVGIGFESLRSNTTGTNNTAVGYQAGYSNTTGEIDAFGEGALYANTTGLYNCGFGRDVLAGNTTGASNTALGRAAMPSNTTGSNNVAIGHLALLQNTTSSNNTAVGYQAGYSNTTGSENTFVGQGAGYFNTTGANNAFFGRDAGSSITTGVSNTFIGRSAGESITTGTKNTILGRYTGNQGGLDIRTSPNHIVLSDGDGNPRGWCDNLSVWNFKSVGVNPSVRAFASGASDGQHSLYVDKPSTTTTTNQCFVGFTINSQSTASGQINANGANSAAFGTFSDRRLKENIVDLPPQLSNIMALRPIEFDYIASEGGGHQISFVAQEFEEVYPDAVGERSDGMKTLTGWSKTEARLVKAIQELKADLDATKAELAALKGA
jgi:hypothetical protein